MRKKFALDIDGCGANFIDRALRDINRIVRPVCPFVHDDVTSYMIEHALGLTVDQTDELTRCIQAEGWCASIPAYAGVVEAISELRTIVDVHPVTAPFASRYWGHERLRWLHDHFGIPKHDVVQTDSKNLVFADYFLEDRTATLIDHRAFWRARGIETVHILMTRPYNVADEWDGIRVASWPEVKGVITSHLASSQR